jgi:hypothetical protein
MPTYNARLTHTITILGTLLTSGIAMPALTGCAGQSGALGPPLAPAVTHLQPSAGFVRDATFNVSGTYDGGLRWTEKGKSYSASLKLTLAQAGRKISGYFEISRNGKTVDLSLEGTVKIKGKKKAALAFTVYDSKGADAKATATVKGANLSGKATAGKARISFSAKKAK